MPIAQITIIEGRNNDQKAKLIAKVSDAIAESLNAPLESVRVLINEIPASHFGAGGKPKG